MEGAEVFLSNSFLFNQGLSDNIGAADPYNLNQQTFGVPSLLPNQTWSANSTATYLNDSSTLSTQKLAPISSLSLNYGNLEVGSWLNQDSLTGSHQDELLAGFIDSDWLNSSTIARAPFILDTSSEGAIFPITSPLEGGPRETRFDTLAQLHPSSNYQLTPEILEQFRQEVISRWASVGVAQTDLATLTDVKLQLADLAGSKLGLQSGRVIQIDQDAAGRGWFIDASPWEDSEFSKFVSEGELQAEASDLASGYVDLLTVIAHEMGHALGLEHPDSSHEHHHLMSAALSPGIRRLLIGESLTSIQSDEAVDDALELSDNTLTSSSTSTESALAFDENDYVTVPHSAVFNTGVITVEAWIKGVATTSWSKVIGKGPDASEVFGLYLYPNSGIFRVERTINGSQGAIDSGIAIGDNNWHHLAYTYNGLIETLYVDGIQRAERLITGSLTSNSQAISIGREVSSSTSQYQFNGTIDEVRIWNVARTQADIQADMGNRLLGNESGLISYWNFDEGSGGIVLDKTANGNNGSLGGGVSASQPVWTTSAAPSNLPEVVPSEYRNAVLADAPMGYWSLDELNWPVAVDSSGNGRSGSYLNGVILGASGSLGTAVRLDGVNDTLEIPINSPETNYTYELWFKTSVATGGISIVRDGAGSHDRLLYLKDGNIYHGLWNSETIGSSNKNYADDKWHHMAVVVQSGMGQKLYVDGDLVASGSKGQSDFNRTYAKAQ